MPWLVRFFIARFGMRILGWAWRKFQARHNAAAQPTYRRGTVRKMY